MGWISGACCRHDEDNMQSPWMPLALCGACLVRLFKIVLALLDDEVQVLLCDSLEVEQHYSVMPGLLNALCLLCSDLNKQIIASTQNAELLETLCLTFEPQEIDSFFRFLGCVQITAAALMQ